MLFVTDTGKACPKALLVNPNRLQVFPHTQVIRLKPLPVIHGKAILGTLMMLIFTMCILLSKMQPPSPFFTTSIVGGVCPSYETTGRPEQG